MGMPRFYRGAPVSADALNQAMQELDYQSLACRVRRSSPVSASQNVDRIVAWQVEDWDTWGGGMWSPLVPSSVVVRVGGVYSLLAQVRFDAVSTAAPYNSGQRAAKLLVNSTDVYSTDPAAGPVNSAKEGWATDGEGVTLTLTADVLLAAGDRVYLNYWHSAAGTINCLHQNFGGTYLSVTRKAALAA